MAWHVLWTYANQEHCVQEQLLQRGFQPFLPSMDAWVRRQGTRHHASVPMFPRYLFLHHDMDAKSYTEVRRTRGLMKILGRAWHQLDVVPDAEIEAIRRLQDSHLAVRRHPYPPQGQRVRIADGVLAGTEGFLQRSRFNTGLLIFPVAILQRSVAVEIDCAAVIAT
jgi:transcriptional antiterminator RfaH